MVSMTAAFAVAGVTQVYLERRVGMDFLAVQQELAVHFLGSFWPPACLRLAFWPLLYVCALRLASRRGRSAVDCGGRVSHEAPYYRPIHREVEVFHHAYRNQLALMLKGPTGCGKSRFVEAMAVAVDRPWSLVAATMIRRQPTC